MNIYIFLLVVQNKFASKLIFFVIKRVNSAIALAGDPAAMAEAMGQAVMAGRTAHLSGRLPRRDKASASSPTTGLVQSPQ